MQHELENQHTKAKRLAGYGRRPGVMSDFQAHWITTGVATVRKHGPRLNIFSTPPPTRPPAPGVHIHATGAMVAASLRRARAAGWAIEATDVGQDGHETLRLRARGIVPTVATHGTRAAARAAAPHGAGGEPPGGERGADLRGEDAHERQHHDDHHHRGQRHGAAAAPGGQPSSGCASRGGGDAASGAGTGRPAGEEEEDDAAERSALGREA